MKSLPILLASFFLSCSFLFRTAYAQDNSDTSYILQLNTNAMDLSKKGEYDSALILLFNAQHIALKIDNPALVAKCLHNIGYTYNGKGDYNNSIVYYQQALHLLRQQNAKDKLPVTLLNLGISYKEQGLYDNAVEHLIEALPLFEAIHDTIKWASAYNTLGNVFMLNKSYEEALEYHFLSLKFRKKVNYEKGIAGSLNNIGIVYKKLGILDSALYYLDSSLQLKSLQDNPEQYANTLSHQAEIYLKQNKKELAEELYLRALDLRAKTGNKKILALSFYELGFLYSELGQYVKSEENLLKSIELSDSLAALDLLSKNYDIIRKLYRKTKNNEKALKYDELFIVTNDLIFNEEKEKAIENATIKYETERKQEESLRLLREKDNEISTRKKNNTYQLFFIILLTLTSLLLWQLFRSKAAHAKKMDMVMRELHHRVENNLQIISSLLSLQSEKLQDYEAKEAIKNSENRVNSMMLIHRNLYFDQEITRIKISSYLHDLVDSLRIAYGFSKEDISIVFNIDSRITLDVDKVISLGILSNELISNAFKHAFNNTNNHPKLYIELHEKDKERYILIIQDNGKGNTATTTRSFGLKLVESQVKRLKGTLNVTMDNGLIYSLLFS